MSEEQSAGELFAFGIIDQATQLAKSARMTQQTLELQIAELVAMEARVNAAVQSMYGAVKSIEGERAKLAAERKNLEAVSPTLQQNAVWAVREAIREQSGQIKLEMRSEVREGMLQPLKDIQAGARHVRENVKETRWLVLAAYVMLGMGLGLAAGYLPVRSDLNALTEHVNRIDGYLTAQQPKPAPAPTPGTPPPGKKHGQK